MSTDLARKALQAGRIMALASTSEGAPHVCTVFYVTLDERRLWFKSRVASTHSKALAADERCAVSIYDPASTYEKKCGMQLRGIVRRILDPDEMNAAVRLYGDTFSGAAEKFDDVEVLVSAEATSTMYEFRAKEYKMVDSAGNVLVESFEPVDW